MSDNEAFERAQLRFAVDGVVAIAASLHRFSPGAHEELAGTIRRLLADLRKQAPEWDTRERIDRLDRLLM
ncbi:hypothetical protein [Sphingomonas desiccabilis]|uniref:hypothetical protein n=1 Tax=Sphingomonas desiccabilis TaxID=429134 RepID=UPI00160FEF13|nr:hypothetical protein [Sphingomonas desiccabilis]